MAKRSLTWLVVWIAYSLRAYDQSDSRSLRAAFGSPTKRLKNSTREVFQALPGLGLTATYAPDHKLCKVEIASGSASKQQVDEVLDKAVPPSARGKMAGTLENWTGLGGYETRYYQKVIIFEEIFTSNAINKNPGATVAIKERTCGWQPRWDPFDTTSGASAASGQQK